MAAPVWKIKPPLDIPGVGIWIGPGAQSPKDGLWLGNLAELGKQRQWQDAFTVATTLQEPERFCASRVVLLRKPQSK